jgi:hypothetical protein
VVSASEAIQRARLNDYGDGVAHGFETVLRLLLGEPVDGAAPFAGPLTPEAERWARAALARIDAAKPSTR